MAARNQVLLGALLATASVFAPCGPAGVVLRYVYKPGTTLRYNFTDVTTSTVKVGDAPESSEFTVTTTGVLRKTVVSASGDQGVVEDAPVKGATERTDSRGTTSQVLGTEVSRYTFTTQGGFIKVERMGVGGQRDSAPRPFDGFAFTLPARAVQPGATWSESVKVVGPDLKPFPVRATSTYRGPAMRAARQSDRMDVTFEGSFATTTAGSAGPVQGSLHGKTTYYMARDLGQEVEASTTMTVTYRGTAAGEGKPQPVVRTVTYKQDRTLTK